MDQEAMADERVPAGLRVETRGGALVVTARAGKVTAALMVAFIIAMLWTAKWALDLVRLLHERAHQADFGPQLFVSALMAAIGAYCVMLLLWSMIGHSRLVVRGGRLYLGNPWLFGLVNHAYDVRRIESLRCAGKDCGAEGEGCCCKFSTVDYTLSFGYGPERISIFPHLDRAAKDWLHARLTAALRESVSPGQNGV